MNETIDGINPAKIDAPTDRPAGTGKVSTTNDRSEIPQATDPNSLSINPASEVGKIRQV